MQRIEVDFFADFINGWEDDKLQNLMDQCGQCTSQAYGGIDCCYDKGVVTKNEDANNCKIDSHFDEQGMFACPASLIRCFPWYTPFPSNTPSASQTSR